MMTSRRRKPRFSVVKTLVVAGAMVLALFLFLPQILSTVGGAKPTRVDASASETLRQLSELEVARGGTHGDAPPYSRDQFGEGWADLNGTNCNTRNDVLARDLDEVVYRPRTGNCVVETGRLDDPYTGEMIEFQRGSETSQAVQIDHVVALADAWRSGAWQWDPDDRIAFANDPLNLLAVDGRANQAKGAATADQWMPPNRDFSCDYAARQVAVKYKWDLQITPAELNALNGVLADCPDLTFVE